MRSERWRGVLRASGKAVWTWPPVVAVDAGGFLQVVVSKALNSPCSCMRLAPSRFRYNPKTYRDLGPFGRMSLGVEPELKGNLHEGMEEDACRSETK